MSLIPSSSDAERLKLAMKLAKETSVKRSSLWERCIPPAWRPASLRYTLSALGQKKTFKARREKCEKCVDRRSLNPHWTQILGRRVHVVCHTKEAKIGFPSSEALNHRDQSDRKSSGPAKIKDREVQRRGGEKWGRRWGGRRGRWGIQGGKWRVRVVQTSDSTPLSSSA